MRKTLIATVLVAVAFPAFAQQQPVPAASCLGQLGGPGGGSRCPLQKVGLEDI
jgi:hypothetical protein